MFSFRITWRSCCIPPGTPKPSPRWHSIVSSRFRCSMTGRHFSGISPGRHGTAKIIQDIRSLRAPRRWSARSLTGHKGCRPRLTPVERKQLFVMKTVYGPMAATRIKFEGPRLRFIAEHKLTPFVMGSLRPAVLTASIGQPAIYARSRPPPTTRAFRPRPRMSRDPRSPPSMACAWRHCKAPGSATSSPPRKSSPRPARAKRNPNKSTRNAGIDVRILLQRPLSDWRPALAPELSVPTSSPASRVRTPLFRPIPRRSRDCCTRASICRPLRCISIRRVGPRSMRRNCAFSMRICCARFPSRERVAAERLRRRSSHCCRFDEVVTQDGSSRGPV